MNKQECDILEALHAEPYINQRVLSDLSGHSLGIVNRSLRQLLKEGTKAGYYSCGRLWYAYGAD